MRLVRERRHRAAGALVVVVPLLLLLLSCCGGSGSRPPAASSAGSPGTTAAGKQAATATAAAGSLQVETKWKWLPAAPASAGMPAADEQGVAVTSGRHRLTLLDDAGKVKWEADRLSLRDVAPALTPDLVLAAADDGVAAYDRATGRPRWDANLGQRANTPAVAGGRAVVTTWEGALVALDLGSGTVVWRVDLGGDALGPAAVAAGRAGGANPVVLATFDTGRVAGAVAVDVATGKQRWSVPLKADGVSAPAVSAGGTVVVVAADVSAHGLSLDDGSEKWRRPLEGSGSPEVPPRPLADGTVLVGHRQGGMVQLDGRDGTIRWEARSDGAAVRGGPAGPGPNGWFALPLADGRLLLGGPDRKPQARKPDSAVTGVASGPGGLLVYSTGQGAQNAVTAVVGW